MEAGAEWGKKAGGIARVDWKLEGGAAEVVMQLGACPSHPHANTHSGYLTLQPSIITAKLLIKV